MRASGRGASTITNLRANAAPANNKNTNSSDDEDLVLVERSTQERRHLLLSDWDPCSSSDECENGCCSNGRSSNGMFKCTPMENGFDSKFCITSTSNIEVTESQEGTCGNGDSGNNICPDRNECCSAFGYCGTTPQYCDPPTAAPNVESEDGQRPGSLGIVLGLLVVMAVLMLIVLIRGKYLKVTRNGQSCIVRWEWNDKSSSKMSGIGHESRTTSRPPHRRNPQSSITDDSLYTTDSSSFHVNHKHFHGPSSSQSMLGGVPPPEDSSSIAEPSLYSTFYYPPQSDCMESSVTEYSVLNIPLPRVEEDEVVDGGEKGDSRPCDNRTSSDVHVSEAVVYSDIVYEDINLQAKE